ncbi:MAG: hypothetical protein IKT27_04960, partial [Clostridia bacterium]|nr:hypothetical protein [Clostridia bacterium]
LNENSIEETANMLGYENVEQLAKACEKNEEIYNSALDLYRDNLFDAAKEAEITIHTSDYTQDLFETGLMHGFEYVDATQNSQIFAGAGVALTMASMLVGNVLLHKQQKRVAQLNKELEDEKKQNQIQQSQNVVKKEPNETELRKAKKKLQEAEHSR